jgi:hypothetical protein
MAETRTGERISRVDARNRWMGEGMELGAHREKVGEVGGVREAKLGTWRWDSDRKRRSVDVRVGWTTLGSGGCRCSKQEEEVREEECGGAL